MIVPPKMLATAAVSPSRMLMRIGFISRQRGSYQFSVLSSQFSVASAMRSFGTGIHNIRGRMFMRHSLRMRLVGTFLRRTDMGESYKNLIAWAQGNGSGDRS